MTHLKTSLRDWRLAQEPGWGQGASRHTTTQAVPRGQGLPVVDGMGPSLGGGGLWVRNDSRVELMGQVPPLRGVGFNTIQGPAPHLPCWGKSLDFSELGGL